MTEKRLGKIKSCKFGLGGYQDAQLGFSFVFQGPGWGVQDFWGTWATWYEGCKWSMDDQSATFAANARAVCDTLTAAKVMDISQLAGAPVEMEFDNGVLKSWRILTEVL